MPVVPGATPEAESSQVRRRGPGQSFVQEARAPQSGPQLPTSFFRPVQLPDASKALPISGAAIFGGAAKLGQDLQQAGNQFLDLAQNIKNEEDEIELKTLDLQLANAVRTYSFGDPNAGIAGYLSTKHQDAIDGQAPVTDTITAEFDLILSNAGNDRIRERLSLMANERLAIFSASAAEHATKQRKEFLDVVSTATLVSIESDVALDPTTMTNGLGRARSEVEGMMLRNGIHDKIAMEAGVREAQSTIVMSAIDARLQYDDLGMAQYLLREHGRSMTGPQRAEAFSKVFDASSSQLATTMFDTIQTMTSKGQIEDTEEAKIDAARSMASDPAIREKLLSLLIQDAGIENRAADAERSKLLDARTDEGWDRRVAEWGLQDEAREQDEVIYGLVQDVVDGTDDYRDYKATAKRLMAKNPELFTPKMKGAVRNAIQAEVNKTRSDETNARTDELIIRADEDREYILDERESKEKDEANAQWVETFVQKIRDDAGPNTSEYEALARSRLLALPPSFQDEFTADIVSKLSQAGAQERARQTAFLNESTQAASRAIESGTLLSDFKTKNPDQWFAISGDADLVSRLKARQVAAIEGRKYAEVTDPATQTEVYGMSADELVAADLSLYRHDLSQTDYATALSYQKAVLDRANQRFPEVYNEIDQQLRAVAPSNLDWGETDEGSDDFKRRQLVTGLAYARVSEFLEANKISPTGIQLREVAQKAHLDALTQLTTRATTFGVHWWDTDKDAYDLDYDDLNENDIATIKEYATMGTTYPDGNIPEHVATRVAQALALGQYNLVVEILGGN